MGVQDEAGDVNENTAEMTSYTRNMPDVNATGDLYEGLDNFESMTDILINEGDTQSSIIELIPEVDVTPWVRSFIDDLMCEVVNKYDCNQSVDKAQKKPKLYSCPKCKKLFAQFPSAKKHCEGERANKSFICSNCNKAIDKKNWRRHVRDCGKPKKQRLTINNPVFKCQNCNKVLSSKQRLSSHMVKVHDVDLGESLPVVAELSQCDKCDFSHRSKNVVRGHMTKVHPSGEMISCKECEYQCRSDSGLKKHYRKVHGKSKNSITSDSSVKGSSSHTNTTTSNSVTPGSTLATPTNPVLSAGRNQDITGGSPHLETDSAVTLPATIATAGNQISYAAPVPVSNIVTCPRMVFPTSTHSPTYAQVSLPLLNGYGYPLSHAVPSMFAGSYYNINPGFLSSQTVHNLDTCVPRTVSSSDSYERTLSFNEF